MDKKYTLSHTTNPDNPDDPKGIHQYYLSIIRAMPNNVYWLDKNCITQGCNDNVLKMLGLEKLEDFIGINYEEMGKMAGWVEGQAESFKKDDMEVITSGKPKINVEEPTIYDAKGNPLYYLSTRVPLFDQSNNVIGVVGISVDITERKKAEQDRQKAKEQLEKNNQAKAKFLRILQHKLRNTLTGILSFSDLLLDSLEDKELLKKGLVIINRAGREILPTLDRINHYLSLELGHLKPRSIPFNLTITLQHFEKDYEKELSAKGLKMKCILDPKVDDRFEGDFALICDVLEHLVKNAIKHTEHGTVTLETHLLRKRGEYMWLDVVVSDMGPGIPREAEKGIFKSFDYDPEDKQYTNPGINLSISKKIAQLLGGDLLVDSFEGKGTAFIFHLKLKREKPAKSIPIPEGRLSYEEVSARKLEPFQPEFGKDKFLVLVVEDDPLNQEALKALLSTYFHCDILMASDLKTAKKQAHGHWKNIDLILTDIQLPDGEGQEIIPYLHTLYPSQECFPWIIAITAFAREIDIQNFIEQGATDVIAKPITLKDLSVVIVSLFGEKVIKQVH